MEFKIKAGKEQYLIRSEPLSWDVCKPVYAKGTKRIKEWRSLTYHTTLDEAVREVFRILCYKIDAKTAATATREIDKVAQALRKACESALETLEAWRWTPATSLKSKAKSKGKS
jgi:hypothetical protein